MKHANISFFIPHEGCPNACSFCNQRAITRKTRSPEPDEIRNSAESALLSLGSGAENAEIAYFGGSFTALPRKKMEEYLSYAAEFIRPGGFHGIRISTRPDAISPEILEILRKYKVTAIELGAQSMNNSVLQGNNRGHTSEDTRKAAGLIQKYGFSLGLQMMTGLPGDTGGEAIRTAEEFIKIRPDSVRIYPVAVLRGTQLANLMSRGEYTPPGLGEAVELCSRLLLLFHNANIPVIRAGLHEINKSEYFAGAFHPAFRELCESKIYLNILENELKTVPPGKITIYGSSGEMSKISGHGGSNLKIFRERGYKIKLLQSPDIPKYKIKVVWNFASEIH